MEKPLPADFGFTVSEVEALREEEREYDILRHKLIVGLAVATWIIAIIIHCNLYVKDLATLIGSVLVCAMLGLFTYPLGYILGQILWINNRRLKAFDKAIDAYRIWKIQQLRAYWLGLDSHSFELAIGRLLRQNGYNTTLTPRTRDGGIDIIAKKGIELVAVQCKAHAKPVGPAVVRDLYGAMRSANPEYTRGILATRSGATSGAYDFVLTLPIDIWNMDDILNYAGGE